MILKTAPPTRNTNQMHSTQRYHTNPEIAPKLQTVHLKIMMENDVFKKSGTARWDKKLSS